MSFKTEEYVLNVGPQHPSTHGVFRMRITLDGEIVKDVEPIFGYLHRGVEKLMEMRTYKQGIPMTDRLDYVSAINNNWPYVMAVEELAGIEVPEKAEYMRVIMAEMQRISSHYLAVGSQMNDMGSFYTVFMYMFREREKLTDLMEMVTGQRMMYNYMRFGGVSQDFPKEFVPLLRKFLRIFPKYMKEYEDLLYDNEIYLSRTKGVGILTREDAINISTSGPVLRSAGVDFDVRRDLPYSIYNKFKFDVPVGKNGDVYDRVWIRMEEMKQSASIIEQALDMMPAEGKYQTKVPVVLHIPEGKTYKRIESPRGILGCYLESDGSDKPYRCHFRAPAFINLTALKKLMVGQTLSDAIITFGSVDLSMGEVDR